MSLFHKHVNFFRLTSSRGFTSSSRETVIVTGSNLSKALAPIVTRLVDSKYLQQHAFLNLIYLLTLKGTSSETEGALERKQALESFGNSYFCRESLNNKLKPNERLEGCLFWPRYPNRLLDLASLIMHNEKERKVVLKTLHPDKLQSLYSTLLTLTL